MNKKDKNFDLMVIKYLSDMFIEYILKKENLAIKK